jgi:hypothetical protein
MHSRVPVAGADLAILPWRGSKGFGGRQQIIAFAFTPR